MSSSSTGGVSPMQAASRMPAYQALALDIKGRGIDAVFGLMSDDTALFITTLDGMGVRYFGARHENNAIAMAEGYAAATGRIGMAIIGRGPATANALHGAVYAQRTGSQVLLIFGASSTTAMAPGAGPSMDPKAFNAHGVLEVAGFKTFLWSTPRPRSRHWTARSRRRGMAAVPHCCCR